MDDLSQTTPATTEDGVSSLSCTHRYGNGLYQALRQLKVSLIISTYKAGQIVSVWGDEDSKKCGASYARVRKPMGMSWRRGRLVVATEAEVCEFQQLADVKIADDGQYDALFYPNRTHYTGEIQAHDVGQSLTEIFVVNTAFSCIYRTTRDGQTKPFWQPSFITQLLPVDRCHLNGMAMLGGKPAYVTALGETDVARGWRDGKATGGCIINVATNEVVLRGLSMPHSPKLHRDALYFINSGEGQLCRLDLESREVVNVAELPGFGRGLSIVGNYAFVALSKARETAVFGELPITSTGKELICGVIVVDIRDGKRIGLFEFATGVTELFEVLAVPYRRARVVGPNMEEDGFGKGWLLGDQFIHAKNGKKTATDENRSSDPAS